VSCNQTYEELMHQYLDEELDAAGRKEFEAHMASCPQCLAHFQELGSAIQEVMQADWLKAPPGFTENLLARLEREHPPRRNWRPAFMKYAGVASAAVLVFGLGFSFASPDEFSLQANNTQGLIVENGKVIVPEGSEYLGDLVIQNGDVEVRGKVRGSVTALNGHIYQSATADISGETVVVDEAMERLLFYAKRIWNEITALGK
jgi:anti-sigma factor RsiW